MGEAGHHGNTAFNPLASNVDLYVVPVHGMTLSELLGELNYSVMNSHVKHSLGNYSRRVKEGVIEQIIKLGIMATNLVMGDKSPSAINSPSSFHKHDETLLALEQFLIHTHSQPDHEIHQPNTSSPAHPLPTSRWFVLDLSVNNETSAYIYDWLCSAFYQHNFVFLNQHSLHWDHNDSLRISYTKKNQFNSSHGTATLLSLYLVKIVVLVHPELIHRRGRNGLSKF